MYLELFNKEIYKGVGNRLKESFIKNNYNDFYNFIINNYKDGETFLEKLYIFHNQNKKCKNKCYCGKSIKFINFKVGYLEYCSIKCSSNSPKTRIKFNKTCMDKYGVNNPSKSDDIKKIKEDTFMEKYGVKTILNHKIVKDIIIEKYGHENPFSSDIIKEKIKKKNIEKYGNSCPLLNDEVKNKTKLKNIEKYGVTHFSKSEEFREIITKKNTNRYLESIKLESNYEFIDKYSNLNRILHIDCNNIFEIQTQLLRKRTKELSEICTICNCNNYVKENELINYIKEISNLESFKYRDSKFEIDIYIPELKIGFEFNGLYWHSELFKDEDYHLNKTIYFNNIGIDIIHIWEDDWKYKQDIIKSIIKSKLNIYENKIYARNCLFREVSSKECKEFLNNNHIQGFCVSSNRCGLYHNNELVSLITLGKRRLNLGYKNKKNDYELLRFCNKINYNIVGGFSKLWKNFLNGNKIDKIITYSDRSLFSGKVYDKNGFNFIGFTKPGYHYINKGIRVNRFNYNKSKLIKMGYDINKTEREIMFNEKIYRIYDCGNFKFEFLNNNI